MIKHLFTIIWNKKKQNLLLMTEILFSFLVMFAVFTLVVYYFQNYSREMGFEYENVWVINYSGEDLGERQKADASQALIQNVTNTLTGMPEILAFSYASNNVPFSMSTNTNEVTYQKTTSTADRYGVDDQYPAVMNIEMVQGRWFSKVDDATKYPPIIINQTLSEKLFGNENPIGKLVGKPDEKNLQKIVGVVKDLKDKGDYQGFEAGMFHRLDTSSYKWLSRILIKVQPDADASFESRLHFRLSNILKSSNVEIEHLSKKRISKNNLTLVPMIILLVVAGFLVINVALGLFGVLWYNISKRKGEIGLRRAVGASGRSIVQQIVGETFVLATFAMAIGTFFAVQFPLLHVFDLATDTYLIALVLAMLFIYALVVICSLYPGRQAAAIYPAVALHED